MIAIDGTRRTMIRWLLRCRQFHYYIACYHIRHIILIVTPPSRHDININISIQWQAVTPFAASLPLAAASCHKAIHKAIDGLRLLLLRHYGRYRDTLV